MDADETQEEQAKRIVRVVDQWIETEEYPAGGVGEVNWCLARYDAAKAWLKEQK